MNKRKLKLKIYKCKYCPFKIEDDKCPKDKQYSIFKPETRIGCISYQEFNFIKEEEMEI